ncbi:MAG: hypothetical protein NT027_13925, partial [Proteobacteria bacterium]|nr:hypothetical protein [Pseudomonadota bacterium]
MHKTVRSNLDSFQKLMDLQDRQPHRLQGSNHGADSSVYQVVLNHIWNSRFSAAADLASETIANFDDDTSSDEQEQLTMQLYRAWIEALVNLEDRDSLSYLANHLLLLGQEQSEKHSVQKYNLLGLRGIIHAELDQAPAVRLMIRSLSSHNESYYVLEFLQICARRGLSDSDFIITN